MTDRYAAFPVGMTDPASNALAVTPSGDPLPFATRAVWVGTGGDLEVTMVGGQTVVFTAVPDGTALPIRVTHIIDDNTTASNILAIW